MSAWGQPEKGSRRAYVFRNAIDSCRKRAAPALTLSAISGHKIASRIGTVDVRRVHIRHFRIWISEEGIELSRQMPLCASRRNAACPNLLAVLNALAVFRVRERACEAACPWGRARRVRARGSARSQNHWSLAQWTQGQGACLDPPDDVYAHFQAAPSPMHRRQWNSTQSRRH